MQNGAWLQWQYLHDFLLNQNLSCSYIVAVVRQIDIKYNISNWKQKLIYNSWLTCLQY